MTELCTTPQCMNLDFQMINGARCPSRPIVDDHHWGGDEMMRWTRQCRPLQRLHRTTGKVAHHISLSGGGVRTCSPRGGPVKSRRLSQWLFWQCTQTQKASRPGQRKRWYLFTCCYLAVNALGKVSPAISDLNSVPSFVPDRLF